MEFRVIKLCVLTALLVLIPGQIVAMQLGMPLPATPAQSEQKAAKKRAKRTTQPKVEVQAPQVVTPQIAVAQKPGWWSRFKESQLGQFLGRPAWQTEQDAAASAAYKQQEEAAFQKFAQNPAFRTKAEEKELRTVGFGRKGWKPTFKGRVDKQAIQRYQDEIAREEWNKLAPERLQLEAQAQQFGREQRRKREQFANEQVQQQARQGYKQAGDWAKQFVARGLASSQAPIEMVETSVPAIQQSTLSAGNLDEKKYNEYIEATGISPEEAAAREVYAKYGWSVNRPVSWKPGGARRIEEEAERARLRARAAFEKPKQRSWRSFLPESSKWSTFEPLGGSGLR